MKRFFALLLCCAMGVSLFSGCSSADNPYIPTGDGLTWDEDYTGPATTYPEETQIQELTLAYYPDLTMNPHQCTDYTNRALLSLIYQGLFSIDRDYNVEPMLCGRFIRSADMMTYVFYVDENATFSDGTPVTAEDVVASLQSAKNAGVYRSRFSKVNSFTVTEDGGIKVSLSTAYENFPLLLDVPILKATELELERPLGTGPYVLSETVVGAQLLRRSDWWCSSDMAITAPVISLVEAESVNQIRDEFQFGALDLVQADPGSDRYADYLCDYELWDSENGIFLYLVCNRDSDVMKNEAIWSAVTYAIDRELLVSEYYRGFARPASLPASPLSPYYNENLAAQYDYDPEVWKTAVQNAQLSGRELTMIVNGKDSLRVRVANTIAEMLEAGGVTVTIESYSGSEYTYALNTLEYDLYLGQTILSPNMDLSHFFAGNGNLRYGQIHDLSVYALCQQALENHGNYYTLHQEVMERGLICPILFRSYAVYATRGLLTELTPSRDNVFYYSIGKSVDEILVQE